MKFEVNVTDREVRDAIFKDAKQEKYFFRRINNIPFKKITNSDEYINNLMKSNPDKLTPLDYFWYLQYQAYKEFCDLAENFSTQHWAFLGYDHITDCITYADEKEIVKTIFIGCSPKNYVQHLHLTDETLSYDLRDINQGLTLTYHTLYNKNIDNN